jgi:hypothetical protein
MTWAEFKAAVEAAGVKDDTHIFAIDVNSWPKDSAVIVERGADDSVWVKRQ